MTVKTSHVLWGIAIIAAIALIFVHKAKVCVDTQGNARQISWLFPCKADEQAVTA